MTSEKMINDLPKMLIGGYEFSGGEKILFVSGGRTGGERLGSGQH